MSGLLLGIVLSVCICWFHSMVTLPPQLVSTDFGTCSYQCFVSNCILVSLHMLKCSCAPTLSCLFTHCSFASIGHANMMWSMSHQIGGRACICYLSLCSIFLSRSILFVTLGLMVPLFHFQFRLLGLPSSAREMCLLH
jgi:hypothetical protein